jgi:hypothetical protein
LPFAELSSRVSVVFVVVSAVALIDVMRAVGSGCEVPHWPLLSTSSRLW